MCDPFPLHANKIVITSLYFSNSVPQTANQDSESKIETVRAH